MAADMNTRWLQSARTGPGATLDVRELDVTQPGVFGAEREAFDLVHCRYLLMHLHGDARLRALQNMVAALKPRGWLLVEEPDFDTMGAVDPRSPEGALFDRTSSAIMGFMAGSGRFDNGCGRKLWGHLEGMGLTEMQADASSTILPEGSPEVRAYTVHSYELCGALAVAAGALPQEEVDALLAVLRRDGVRTFSPTTWGVWGRRPEAPAGRSRP